MNSEIGFFCFKKRFNECSLFFIEVVVEVSRPHADVLIDDFLDFKNRLMGFATFFGLFTHFEDLKEGGLKGDTFAEHFGQDGV